MNTPRRTPPTQTQSPAATNTTPSPARQRLLAALPLRERRRTLAGISTAVLEGGEGSPLVLLHGPGGHAAHWLRIIPELVSNHHVIAPDLPGHGATALGPDTLDAERMLDWLEALIDESCPQPPVLVGELVGGAIAARFAARAGARLARLVLVDSFGLCPFRPTPEFARVIERFALAPDAKAHEELWSLCAHDVKSLRRQLGPLWEAFETYNVECARSPQTQSAMQIMLAELATEIPADELARIAVPTTLIWGAHDLGTPATVARSASDRYGWTLHVIDGANDAPAIEQPEAFLSALLGDRRRASPARPDGVRPVRKGREEVDSLVIGAGQAGLATSHWLRRAGIEHLVLERRQQLGGSWHDRWDSFHLVAPNFTLLLPGMPYAGPDPEAFMPRDQVIDYVKAYAEFCAAPVRLGCDVESLRVVDGRFEAETPATIFVARQVVLATGPYQRPKRPAFAEQISPHVRQLHSHDYRRPADLAAGGVLVVGTGQSGTQIAEELHGAGRDVHLAVSLCPSVPRRYRGRDVIWWLLHSFVNREKLGLPFPTVTDLPTPAQRFACNPHCSGKDGGHDIHLRQFARRGIHLYGRLESAAGTQLRFSSDLAERLAFADSKFDEEFRPLFDAYIAAASVAAPPDDRPPPDDYMPPTVTELDLDAAGIVTVIWATGYRLDFNWVDLPIFDEWGYPRHVRGVTEQPGLYAVGLPWLYSEPSSVFAGVGEDAAHVVEELAKRRR